MQCFSSVFQGITLQRWHMGKGYYTKNQGLSLAASFPNSDRWHFKKRYEETLVANAQSWNRERRTCSVFLFWQVFLENQPIWDGMFVTTEDRVCFSDWNDLLTLVQLRVFSRKPQSWLNAPLAPSAYIYHIISKLFYVPISSVGP